MANIETKQPLAPLSQNHNAEEVQKSDLVEQVRIGNLYNLNPDVKIKFSYSPVFKVAKFSKDGEFTTCNMVSCIRIKEGKEYLSWFNLNYLLAKDGDGLPIFPEYYVISNLQERIDALLENTMKRGEFTLPSSRDKEFQTLIYVVTGQNGYDMYRYLNLPAYTYRHVEPCKKFDLKLQKNADHYNLIQRAFHLLKILMMIAENKDRFTSNYHIQFDSGLFDGRNTFGLDYSPENYTYTIRSEYKDLRTVIHELSLQLSNLTKEYLSLLPSNVGKSVACDLYKQFFYEKGK